MKRFASTPAFVALKNCFAVQVLCIQGFLACRKHADRIILLVEMMQNSGCPCFKAGPRAVAALRKRFHLTLPESQAIPWPTTHPSSTADRKSGVEGEIGVSNPELYESLSVPVVEL